MIGYLTIISFLFLALDSVGQPDLKTIVSEIENKNRAAKYQAFQLPDSLQDYPCAGHIYFDSAGLHKLEIGCGDAHLGTTDWHYYFFHNEIVYASQVTQEFNAPPAITEEVAKKEGYSEWYDPSKTKTSTMEIYFKDGKPTKMIDNGNEIATSNPDFKKIAAGLNADVKQGKDVYKAIEK